MSALPIRIRGPVPDDCDTIVDSWLRSQRDETHYALMSHAVYSESRHHVVTRLLQRSEVRIACSAESDWQVFGWACVEPGTLHYAYVKAPFRRFGIFAQLIEGLHGARCSATGHKWPMLVAKYGFTYDPRGEL